MFRFLHRRLRKVGAATLTLLGLFFMAGVAPQPLPARGCQPAIAVTSSADSGPGTLRQALADLCAGGVIIVPLLPDNQTILLRQYRYPVEDYSWELPMGGINPGESDEAAALRELQEETHLTATSLKRLAVYYPVPGLTPQKATVFTAAINPSIPLDLSPFGADDIHERQVISLTKVDQMILDGIIRDGFTLVGWLFFKLSRAANFSENSPH